MSKQKYTWTKEGPERRRINNFKIHKGRRATPETRAKMSLIRKGKKIHNEMFKARIAARNRTSENRAKVSIALTGRCCSEATKEKIRQKAIGRKVSEEARKKMKEAARTRPPVSLVTRLRHSIASRNLVKLGKHPWYKGKPPVQRDRNSFEYKQWRRHVYQRDDYTCQACGQWGGKLHADHELPFSLFPALRHEILNGRTLCINCHKKTPTYGWKLNHLQDNYV